LKTIHPRLNGMQCRWPTRDIAPMSNPAVGCLIDGGHRELITPLNDALIAVTRRSEIGTFEMVRYPRVSNTARPTVAWHHPLVTPTRTDHQ
jgi:hypothetical protein